MVSIVKVDRDNITRIEGNVIDLDGYYFKLFKKAELLENFDFYEVVSKIAEIAAKTKELYIFSYDTLSFLFMKRYGRKRYKLFLSNFIRSLRIIECVTGSKIALLRYSEYIKNDPGTLDDYKKDCF